MDIKKVAVIGGGTMGNGIAHVAALSGFQVALVDLEPRILDRAIATIDKNLQRAVDKEKLTAAEKSETLARIDPHTSLDIASESDLVIEAIIESEEAKRTLFSKLDELCKSDTILASNTSSISITRIAAVTKRPDKVIGMHFMNPVPIMKLVEVIRGHHTSDETYALTAGVSERMGKIAVEDAGPGFAPDLRERAFEPFVTTKDARLHRGLGLTVARLAVEGSGGTLRIEHAPRGARVVARLQEWRRPAKA